MTDSNPNDASLSGEHRLKSKRRAFFKYCTLIFAAAAVLGFFGGYFVDLYAEGGISAAVPIVVFLIAFAGLVWFSWDYFHRIDELDLMDNLWAHLIGQYATMIAFAGWYLLGELGLTTYPTAFATILIMIGATMVIYLLRKLGWR